MMRAQEPDMSGLRGAWKRVVHLPSGNALSVLGTALQALQESVTLLQAGADSCALIARVTSIEAVAHEKPEIEVHDLPSDVNQITLLAAGKSATRDLLEWLKAECIRQSSSLLATTTADFLKAGTIPAGLRVGPTQGTVAVGVGSDKVEFSVYTLSREDAAGLPAFQPVKQPIGEPLGNLGQRSEWFKRRTGH